MLGMQRRRESVTSRRVGKPGGGATVGDAEGERGEGAMVGDAGESVGDRSSAGTPPPAEFASHPPLPSPLLAAAPPSWWHVARIVLTAALARACRARLSVSQATVGDRAHSQKDG